MRRDSPTAPPWPCPCSWPRRWDWRRRAGAAPPVVSAGAGAGPPGRGEGANKDVTIRLHNDRTDLILPRTNVRNHFLKREINFSRKGREF